MRSPEIRGKGCGAGFQPAQLGRALTCAAKMAAPQSRSRRLWLDCQSAGPNFVVRASSLHSSTVEMCSQDGRTTISSRRLSDPISWTKLWCGLPACTAPPSRCGRYGGCGRSKLRHTSMFGVGGRIFDFRFGDGTANCQPGGWGIASRTPQGSGLRAQAHGTSDFTPQN